MREKEDYKFQDKNYIITGKKSKGAWNLMITVYDRYDFDNIRLLSGVSFGNAANDLGWAMQRIGMMIPYKFSVSYRMNL